ncbi:MAG: glycosyltransferase [Planctomycetaceae bacterium]|nr:glycosyltransferase [Planctomycetaceae bacterium]
MRLLVIAPYSIFPMEGGGTIRTVRLAREMSNLGLDVTVITPFLRGQYRSFYQQEPFQVVSFHYPFLLQLFTGRPFPFGYLMTIHPGLGFWLKRFFNQFDALQFEQSFLAGILKYVSDQTLVFYNSQNVDFDYVSSECENFRVRSIATGRTKQAEMSLVKRSAHVFVCSREDGERMGVIYDLPRAKWTVAANGVELPDRFAKDESELLSLYPKLKHFPKRVIFSGSDVPHNRESVQFILEEIAPAIDKHYAVIIHGGCGKKFCHLRRRNVIFDSRYDNFSTWAVPGTIGLNPVEQGSGTNLKLLHYLTHRLPVISTPFGMRGYDDLIGWVTIVERRQLAETLLKSKLASPPDPQWLVAKYGWQRIASHMVQRIQELKAC